MPTRLVHLVIETAEPARLARFWAGALGWEVVSDEPDEVDVCPPGFSYPDPSALPLVFVPVPYVDASASAAFRSKWQRATISAAGIIVEGALAATALFIWLSYTSSTSYLPHIHWDRVGEFVR